MGWAEWFTIGFVALFAIAEVADLIVNQLELKKLRARLELLELKDRLREL